MGVAGAIVVGVIVSYLMGGVPFGFLVGLCYRLDIRKVGSGNIGATNLARALGHGTQGVIAFMVVSLLDVTKGFIPVFFFPRLMVRAGTDPTWTIYLELGFGLAAILGHVFSIYLRLHGGKAVNTSLGVILALAPIPALITLGVWLVVFFIWRYVSLASIVGAATLPLTLWITGVWKNDYRWEGNRLLYVFCMLISALVIVRHVGNIRRLIKGTESRMMTGRAVPPGPPQDSPTGI